MGDGRPPSSPSGSLTTDRCLATVGRVNAWRMRFLAWTAPLLLGGFGCGPVQYIITVTRDAASDVAAAKSVGAEEAAPYEYTAAVEYLHKAREEEGYADHQAAVHFGHLASELAIKAKEIALKHDKPGERPPTPPPPVDSENENPLIPGGTK